MTKINNPETLFYQKLGELFYAIAAADSLVQEAEYKTLAKLVEEKWTQENDFTDSFGRDAAYQIAIVFEWFDYEQMDAEECFKNFTKYYKEHTHLFYGNRKTLIIGTAKTIANSFNATNKSELILITKLALLFDQA